MGWGCISKRNGIIIIIKPGEIKVQTTKQISHLFEGHKTESDITALFSSDVKHCRLLGSLFVY